MKNIFLKNNIMITKIFIILVSCILCNNTKVDATSQKYHKSYSLNYSTSKQLSLKKAAKNYTWKSDNKKLVTVSKSGKINTKKKSGTAYITAKDKKTYKKYVFKITVKHKVSENNATKTMRLSKKEIYVKTDGLKQFPYLNVKNISGYITWSVKDPSVAAIINYNEKTKKWDYVKKVKKYSTSICQIMPIKTGSTIITARYGKQQVSCKVFVASTEDAMSLYIKNGNDKYGLSKKEKQACSVIKKNIREKINSSMTRLQKVRAINDLIVKTTTYNESISDEKYTVIGPTILNKAVCSGYAKTFCVYMKCLDIPVYYIHGYTNSPEGHAWNLVKMDDGHWYHIDVTWNDPDDKGYGLNGLSYTFFLLNDKEMSNGRTWNYSDYPKCIGSSDYKNQVNRELIQETYSDYILLDTKESAISYIAEEIKYNKCTDFKLIYYNDDWMDVDDYNKIREISGERVGFTDVQGTRILNGYSMYTLTVVYY